MNFTYVAVYAAVSLILAAVSSGEELATLHLLVLAPFPTAGETPSSSEFYAGGPLLIPAVELAVQHVNENHSVLADYKLDIVEGNTGCVDELTALLSFTSSVFSGHEQANFVGVIGTPCSITTVTLASLVSKRRSSLLMVGAATSPALALSTEYDTTFRTVQSALAYVDVFLSLMKKNNWERIGVLYDADRFYFYSIFDELAVRINSTEHLNFSSGLTPTFFPTRTVLQSEEIRVMFVLAGGTLSRQLICLVYNYDIIYPKVQWIFSDKRQRYFRAVDFNYEGNSYNCTQEQMDHALDRAIFANYKLERDLSDDTHTVSGLTYREYLKQYINRTSTSPQLEADWTPDNYSNAYYDAVWSMALAINSSIPWFEENNINLVDYRHGHKEATQEIVNRLLMLEFEGMTGPIKYSSTTRDVQTTIELFQMQCNSTNEVCEELYIGNYSGSSLKLTDRGTFIRFGEIEISIVPLSVGIVALIVTGLLTIATIVLHLIYIIFDNYHRIRASSPHLMHLVFSGCYLFIAGQATFVILYSFPIPKEVSPFFHSILCSNHWWCFSMGSSLMFGTICARTWRVYRIFTTAKRNLVFISDLWLICFVLFLLAVSIVFNLIVHLVDPCILQVESTRFDGKGNFLIQRSCSCRYSQYWIIAMFLLHYSVLLCCAVLAFFTRHVNRREFRSTRSINILVYVLTLLYFIDIFLQTVTGDSAPTLLFYYITWILQIFLCQILIFIPPILPRHTLNFITKISTEKSH